MEYVSAKHMEKTEKGYAVILYCSLKDKFNDSWKIRVIHLFPLQL